MAFVGWMMVNFEQELMSSHVLAIGLHIWHFAWEVSLWVWYISWLHLDGVLKPRTWRNPAPLEVDLAQWTRSEHRLAREEPRMSLVHLWWDECYEKMHGVFLLGGGRQRQFYLYCSYYTESRQECVLLMIKYDRYVFYLHVFFCSIHCAFCDVCVSLTYCINRLSTVFCPVSFGRFVNLWLCERCN